MKFKDYFSLRHILFAVFVVAMMLCFAISQSNNVVKVKFQDEQVEVTSKKYSLSIAYSDIVSATLEDLVEPGEKVENAFDDGVYLMGKWKNDTWGEYHICADPDTSKCIVVKLEDGRIMVFSRKSDKETSDLYAELLTHLEK